MSTQPPPQAHVRQAAPNDVETSQPAAPKPMTLQQSPSESKDDGLRLRGGGERGSCCPGRFCFCIPCPLPCDFCII